jgi:SAM-dependent methyltransferase
MDTEKQVAAHYTHGALEQAILDALAGSGKDIEQLTTADLAGVDEFHLGWRPATLALAEDLGFSSGMHVLDVGSGIGGPARTFAETVGCRVTGFDLTEEFVAVANALTQRVGLAGRAAFRAASALCLPVPDASFDGAMMIHVGMNIEDKPRLFAEVRRALKPGALFGVYDVMRTDAAPIPYPTPWADTEATSFVEPLDTYRRLLAAAGFAIEREANRRDLALRLLAEMRAAVAEGRAPPLGLHTLMGPSFKERMANVTAALTSGTLSPVAVVARAG